LPRGFPQPRRWEEIEPVDYVPERNLVGYGPSPPDPLWPKRARVAVNFVINYEEGAEYGVLEGDTHAETLLCDVPPSTAAPGLRDRNVESLYEYGSRVGIWRVLKLFAERGVAPTVYVVGRALELNPAVGEKIAEAGCDTVCHGWRWVDYQFMDPRIEREHIARTVDVIERLTGSRPLGWYTGRPSLNTRRLVVEHGDFLFDCDDYNDELPYWVDVGGRDHLVIPHSFDTNDSRFARGSGLETADQFFAYLKDSFDWLYGEGAAHPKMMTVSLHCRLVGHPGRIAGLARFLDHVLGHDRVWVCQRTEIARHWYRVHSRETAASGS
jgi:putative urate catabolism protein